MKNVFKIIAFVLIGLTFSCGNNPKEREEKLNVGKEEKKDCCKKTEKSLTSEITCPNCGHKKQETLPTDICQLAYTCEKCKTVMHPKEGDCCVFCTYGDHKCPSMQ